MQTDACVSSCSGAAWQSQGPCSPSAGYSEGMDATWPSVPTAQCPRKDSAMSLMPETLPFPLPSSPVPPIQDSPSPKVLSVTTVTRFKLLALTIRDADKTHVGPRHSGGPRG